MNLIWYLLCFLNVGPTKHIALEHNGQHVMPDKRLNCIFKKKIYIPKPDKYLEYWDIPKFILLVPKNVLKQPYTLPACPRSTPWRSSPWKWPLMRVRVQRTPPAVHGRSGPTRTPPLLQSQRHSGSCPLRCPRLSCQRGLRWAWGSESALRTSGLVGCCRLCPWKGEGIKLVMLWKW